MSARPIKQPDVTREKIMDAAYQEIVRHGFQAASLANILAKTGLTKGALYHHFPNKSDLGLAVIDEVIRDIFEQRFFAPLHSADYSLDALVRLIRENARVATMERVCLGCPLNNLMQEMSALDQAFKRSLNGILKKWQETVALVLKRAQQQGKLRKAVDCRAAALFIVSAFEGCVGIAKNQQSVKDFGACLTQLEIYIDGLRIQKR